MHFIHLIARLILSKIHEFQLLANKSKAAIIAVTETWLDHTVSNTEIHLDGYSVIRKDRNRHGGGICMFIRDDLAFTPLPLDNLSESDEVFFLELLLPKTKPIIIGTCYRPPKQSDFVDRFETILSQLRSDCEIIIMGDFNICVIDNKSHLSQTYNKVLKLFGLKQLIKGVTRLTDTSKSLIDHILCNSSEKISQSGVISSGLSDHFITYCTRKIPKYICNKHNNIKIRSSKNYDKTEFVDLLTQADWSKCLYSCSIDDAWQSFKETFTNILDKVAPVKEVRVKQKTEPWMNQDILSNIKERDDYITSFRKFGKDEDYRLYCKYRNLVQRQCKQAKADYFNEGINDNMGNPKKLWSHFKNLGYKQNCKVDSNVILNIDGENSFDNAKIANHFNSFFTTIASKLVDKLPNPSNIFHASSNAVKSFYNQRQQNNDEFILKHVSETFVYKELCNLNVSKSTGLDGIPAKFLKDAAPFIKIPITFLINMSISEATVPKDLKLAKVKPLFKKGDRLKPENYRPVSILSIVSKILEKAVYSQLESFLVNKNILYEFQSGFRSKFSTDSCLIHLTDHIKSETAKGLYTGMVLLDLQKAFDTVDHKILCDKLKIIGVRSVEWFNSYLSNRQQIVNINKTNSDVCNVKCGVPQGSLLGPLLFLIYVNDLKISIDSDCKVLLYADDTAILFSHKDPKIISEKLSLMLESCKNWLTDNKLSLHLGKTESILFGPKRKLKNVTENIFSIVCNGIIIESKSYVKYLGVILDNFLSGEYIVDNIINKANQRLKFLYRYKSCLSEQSRKTLCTALIQCHLDYACSCWYEGLSKKLKDKLQIIQNKIIRFIFDMHPRQRLKISNFEKVGFLNISNRVTQLRLNHVFNIFHNQSPDYLKQYFSRTCSTRNTRSCNFNFFVPRVKNTESSSFYFNGIKNWNTLPDSIKSIDNKAKFKFEVKRHLMSEMKKSSEADFIFY